MTLPDKINQNQLSRYYETKRGGLAGLAVAGAITAAMFGAGLIYEINHKGNVYEKAYSAKLIEVENPKSARPWDYCKGEFSKGDDEYYACLDRLFDENPGYKEGTYLSKIKVPDIDGDGKVSSRH